MLTNGALSNGSVHNIRYEITNKNNKKGTFTLAIERGDNEKENKHLKHLLMLTFRPK